MGTKGGGFFPADNLISIPAAMFRNVRLAVIGERLELNLIDSNDFGHIEDCVQRLCNCQPNTLVSGYGVNLIYTAAVVSNELINSFSADPLSQTSLNQSHRFITNLDRITTNIAIELNKAENKSAIAFNFHFNAGNLSALIQSMAEYPIVTLNQKGCSIFLKSI